MRLIRVAATPVAFTGPFFIVLRDEKVYIDLGLYKELSHRFGAPGEFAEAYVLAHEVGHHVQKILGIEGGVRRAQQRDPSSQNRLSVQLELQADCFAGIWGHSTEQRKIIDNADVQDGLRAAASVGDDRIQKMERGRVSPETFTHGTSAQRVRWFKAGLESGTYPRVCKTEPWIRPRSLNCEFADLPAIAAATTTAAAGRTIGFRARFVDVQRTAIEFLAIQARDRAICVRIGGHFDEAKAFGLAGIAVGDDADTVNGPVCLEHRTNRVFGSSKSEVPYKYIFHLLFPLRLVNRGRIERGRSDRTYTKVPKILRPQSNTESMAVQAFSSWPMLSG
jgi:hypothetical protein